ncbi:cation:proton antiporter [Microbacterium sp. NPDC055910]|uniref:cation:proton antiporter n=1 Tax=Microbacterium sp. NPDC055910 TaxID=3345659 RepID=UPI0035E1F770
MAELMSPLVLIIIGVVVIAGATAVAPKLNIAGPLILVLVGLGVSLLPFVPPVAVDPEIILVGVLPPLLYSAAVSLPAIEFRRDLGHIAGLSVLLVIVSSIALAFFFVAVIPGLPFLLALALGAILSPTDAVATSIVKRLGLSRRVVTLLEGESLLNDATSLVLLRTAIAGVALAGVPAGGFIGAFVWGVIVALIVGGLIGYLNLRLRALVRHSAANTAIGFVVPFAAYLPTEHLGGSGLVAAVVAGIVTGQGSVRWFTPEQRRSDDLNWRTVELMLEGAVFLVMGLELKDILAHNIRSDHGVGHGPLLALTALGIVLVVRGVYVSVLVWLQSRRARGKRKEKLQRLSDRIDHAVAEHEAARHPDAPPHHARRLVAARRRITRAFADLAYYQAAPLGWKHGTIIVWAGMRGVVTLAAAQTLPRDTPERPLLIFVAFLVAVGSLMLQGFTLPWLVRLLRLEPASGDGASAHDRRRLDDELRSAAAAALSHDALTRRDGSAFPAGMLERMRARLTEPPDEDMSTMSGDLLDVRLTMIEAMRRRLIELSSGGEFSTPALRHALAELDADELSVRLRLDE